MFFYRFLFAHFHKSPITRPAFSLNLLFKIWVVSQRAANASLSFHFKMQAVRRLRYLLNRAVVAWWNPEPVLPGEWDTVYAQYDTKRLGNFLKTLTVISHDNESLNTILYVKGEVLPREVQGLLILYE